MLAGRFEQALETLELGVRVSGTTTAARELLASARKERANQGARQSAADAITTQERCLKNGRYDAEAVYQPCLGRAEFPESSELRIWRNLCRRGTSDAGGRPRHGGVVEEGARRGGTASFDAALERRSQCTRPVIPQSQRIADCEGGLVAAQ